MTTPRTITILGTVDNLTLADLRRLVQMADTPLDLPGGHQAPPLLDTARVSAFTVGVRQGLLVEGFPDAD